MKNLNLWNVTVKDLNISSNEKFLMCYGHDEGNAGVLYVCSHNLVVKSFDEDGNEKWCKDLSKVDSGDNEPVDITFLALPNTVCVGFANGELYTISVVGTSCDLAGVFESGLLAMDWSPDQELLVLVTKDMKTVLMSCMYDPIYETSLLDEEFGEKQFITVGWGKKETQFHGREGKQARVIADITADQQADNTVRITWRGDGNLYAIGFTLDGIKRFKVFDREGHLQYTSEKQQGLESNLCWRPSGNVIATTQRLPDKYVVAFFEKNGLKHGGFDIPVNSSTTIEDLLWSSDSEILTLQCRDATDNTQKLLLFTMSNYHWYLKQTLVFSKEQEIRKILWDNDFDVANNKKLHIVLSSGEHYSYTWIWNVDHSQGKTDDDDAVVAVVDGKKILLTGFRQTIVPPPMAAFELEFESFINSVHFAPEGIESTNTFFVITSDHKLILHKQTQKFPLKYEVLNIIELDKYAFPYQYYNLYWNKLIDENIILCATVDKNGYSIVEFKFEGKNVVKKNEESLPAELVRIEPHPTNLTAVFLQLSNGDLVQYTVGGKMEPQNVSFGVACPKFNVISLKESIHFIGLSHKGLLYLDDATITNNVSSFFVHTDFLVITTLQHDLLCTELSNHGLNAIKEYSKSESQHVYKRKIERGAKLVIAVPNGTRTVFQMPRGNLETIEPRPLSLKIIGKHLDALKYHEAFDLMRKQRINLNLIFDHNPEKFMETISVFLESIKNNSWLSLFLTDLENVDVTKTMYSSSYAERQLNENTDDKVRKVCELIRSTLNLRSDKDHRILPILTSFVKTNTVEDLESALSLIKYLKLREEGGTKLPVGSDEALKYLLYMVEVNKLFDVSLGMYDFDLVLLVANKSQKDPKEFIPMLNDLNEMEENYKRFSINKHLKRFDRAVQCLVECGPEKHAELKAFVKYHSLYSEALNLFKEDQEIFKQISEDFGSYLRLKKQFTEAGIVYERGSHFVKAVECYKDALEWELAVCLAQTWPKDQFKQLCTDLLSALKNEKRHIEALIILEMLYDDNEEAIRYAVETGHFKTAIRLCNKRCNERKALKEEVLLPALLNEYKNLKELVDTNWTTFNRHRDRLRVVRENKIKNPVDMYDTFANRDCDLYSDAGSTLASSSRGSTRSYRSGKNKRKHERKVASLKEGSQYEDVGLVIALHTLVHSTFQLRSEVKEVNIALNYFGNKREAFVLQTSLENLLKEMKDSFKEIWSNDLALEAINATIAAQNISEGGPDIIPQGVASLEPHIRIAPVIQDINWKLEGL